MSLRSDIPESYEDLLEEMWSGDGWFKQPYCFNLVMSPTESQLLAFLVNVARMVKASQTNDGWFYHTHKQIQDKLHINRDLQDKAINQLVRRGYLRTERRECPAKRFMKIEFVKLRADILKAREDVNECTEDDEDTVQAPPVAGHGRIQLRVGVATGCDGGSQLDACGGRNKGRLRKTESSQKKNGEDIPPPIRAGGTYRASPVEEKKVSYSDQVPPPPPEGVRVLHWHPSYQGKTVFQLQGVGVDVAAWFPYPGYGVPKPATTTSPPPPEGQCRAEEYKKDTKDISWTRVSDQPFARQCTLVLYEALAQRRKTTAVRTALMGWTRAINTLYLHIQQARGFTPAEAQEELRSSIDWYIAHLDEGNKYIPDIRCGGSLREKYDKLRAAMERADQPKTIQEIQAQYPPGTRFYKDRPDIPIPEGY